MRGRTTGMQIEALLFSDPLVTDAKREEGQRRGASLGRRIEEEGLGGDTGSSAVAFLVWVDDVESPALLAHHCAGKVNRASGEEAEEAGRTDLALAVRTLRLQDARLSVAISLLSSALRSSNSLACLKHRD